MIINRTLDEMMQYLTEAFVRIFSPNDDKYPAIGVQPFYGEIYHAGSSRDW